MFWFEDKVKSGTHTSVYHFRYTTVLEQLLMAIQHQDCSNQMVCLRKIAQTVPFLFWVSKAEG